VQQYDNDVKRRTFTKVGHEIRTFS